MKEYDMIVIGSGSAMNVVEEALVHEKTVAVVDKGPAGGTCLNLGCIPSKMLIAAADKVMEIQEAESFGIKASVEKIDFGAIMQNMRDHILPEQQEIHAALTGADEFDFYEGEGRFVDDYTLEVNGERIRGNQVVIGAGSRPWIPDIPGLDSVAYMTNENVLQLTKCPSSLIIIGGGYIALEYAHFFSAMGAAVTIIEKAEILPGAEPEIQEVLRKDLEGRMALFTGTEPLEVWEEGDIHVRCRRSEEFTVQAEALLVATGRESNADLLAVENTGVERDEHGFIKTNDFLETTRPGIYAVGDVNGRAMFMHAANEEAILAAHNALHDQAISFDYTAIPYAVYTWPQIASVGLTEQEAMQEHSILVSRAGYDETAKGIALNEDRGFAKVIVDKEDLSILGFHIIGPQAPVLIQEVINALHWGGIESLMRGMHIHPALTELIPKTLSGLHEPIS
ncbi:MAG: dihydrolipoyl dehydrogenase [Nanobdellota archaeon]